MMADCNHLWVGLKCQKCGEFLPGGAESPALVAKLAEVWNAELHLDEAVGSLREWFNHRKPGDQFGLRLLDCSFWAAHLQTLVVQVQILVKGEEDA